MRKKLQKKLKKKFKKKFKKKLKKKTKDFQPKCFGPGRTEKKTDRKQNFVYVLYNCFDILKTNGFCK